MKWKTTESDRIESEDGRFKIKRAHMFGYLKGAIRFPLYDRKRRRYIGESFADSQQMAEWILANELEAKAEKGEST